MREVTCHLQLAGRTGASIHAAESRGLTENWHSLDHFSVASGIDWTAGTLLFIVSPSHGVNGQHFLRWLHPQLRWRRGRSKLQAEAGETLPGLRLCSNYS